jgi:hypothetical protein
MGLQSVSMGWMPHRFLSLALVAWLGIGTTACRARWPVSPPRPEEQRTRGYLAHLAALMRAQDIVGLAPWFTPQCRTSCRGFVPMVQSRTAHHLGGRWWPRLQEGTLLADLELVLRSYDTIRVAELTPLRLKVYPREVHVRARLRLEGELEGGEQQSDRGLVDLVLVEQQTGWKIHELVAARVDRVVAAATTSAPVADSGEPDAPEPEPEPEPDAPTQEGPLRLELAVDEGGGRRATLKQLGGSRATLVLLQARRCPTCEALCQTAATAVRSRRGVVAVRITLDRAAADRCPLPARLATAETRAATASLAALLPVVALLNSRGLTLRIWSGSVEATLLEAELDRL